MTAAFENDTLNKDLWFLSILANCKEENIIVLPPVNLENANLYDVSFLDFVFVAREELDKDGNPVNYELIIP